jgi:hypothetical protein
MLVTDLTMPRKHPRYLEFCCTGYTQNNGAVSMVNKGKPHHSFVYTLYIYIKKRIYTRY